MTKRVFNAESVPLLALGYRFQWEPMQDCYVLLYPEGMVKLNPAAGEILKRISEKQQTVGELIAELKVAFDGADLDEDVYQFLEEAYVNDWIRAE
ncbi:pyrroloquinoline quinone biosynthesis peptide chaperone PqqD [Methylophaga nitratireducenticrescens]|uniref:Coenzyme PQQ synthesis protein D n=1 Tax=Methylophaga nitratireducenticrescens TaxID=754476 RepID=I1XH40_METNJ|nr:pyrroloquinoline quinone biosynthesis peptide chaperone PqqD [Methylophaga nitratireducenticrescens]AFI83709.1 pyrroloquinoline quinone biosynthesis protein PqqD [Methylophaga nitratireducenticrescens]AUZ83835.1 pyrroloquinoline quinone biosynthesis protein PqqD [Methylophaga nitratireducenticrescens]